MAHSQRVDDFCLQINVAHFGDYQPQEISVRYVDGYVEVSGHQVSVTSVVRNCIHLIVFQEWRPHPSGGGVRRHFEQRHALPAGFDGRRLTARFNEDNHMLTVTAPSTTKLTRRARRMLDALRKPPLVAMVK